MSAKRLPPRRPAPPELLGGNASLTDVAAQLAWASPAAGAPPPSVKAALLARIRADKPQPAADTTGGWRFATMSAGDEWLALPLPGVRMRELAIDRERDSALLFVAMAPGATFPEHTHSAPERGVVLRGDLQTGERLLRAGDFYEAAAGTRHERISSPSGCEGLLWVSAAAWSHWRAALGGTR